METQLCFTLNGGEGAILHIFDIITEGVGSGGGNELVAADAGEQQSCGRKRQADKETWPNGSTCL